MSDVSKHIRLGNGLTAEFMEGVVVLFRVHKDPAKIPGDIQETFIAHEPADGCFELVDTSGADATFLVHQEDEGSPHEFKAYDGEMGTLSQRRVIKRFLAQISLERGMIERFKNGQPRRAMKVGKKLKQIVNISIIEGESKCQR